MSDKSLYTAGVWMLDFWRAFGECPRITRWLVRLIIGRYAWNELVGGLEAVKKAGYWTPLIFGSYGLEGNDYHKELDKVDVEKILFDSSDWR